MKSCRKMGLLPARAQAHSIAVLMAVFLAAPSQSCPAQQDEPAPAARGLRVPGPIGLQERPDYRTVEVGGHPAGLRFGGRSKPANLFKVAGRKHLPRRSPALPQRAGLKTGKVAPGGAPAIKNPESKLNGPGSWALGGSGFALPVAGDGGGAGDVDNCSVGNFCRDWLVGEAGCGASREGNLTEGDGVLGDGTLVDIWSLEIESTRVVDASLFSPDMNTFLFLVDEDCLLVATNDDCVEGDPDSGSCLRVLLEPGSYYLAVNSWEVVGAGAYNLDVSCQLMEFCGDCVTASVACGETTEGELVEGDCRHPDGTLLDSYLLELSEPSRLSITLSSEEINPYLLVVDSDCAAVGEVDDIDPVAGNLNASLVIDLRPGNYFIIAKASTIAATGTYQLATACEPLDICLDCRVAELGCGAGVVEDGLFEDDCRLADGTFIDVFTFDVAEAARVSLSLSSLEFDTYLLVYDENCDVVGVNDDCRAGDLSLSCLTLDLEAGAYFVAVNSYSPEQTGLYQLSAACRTDFSFCDDCIAGPISCDGQVAGFLEMEDCPLVDDGSFIDLYTFEVTVPGPVIIDLASQEFDSFLRLYNRDCEEVAVDDDGAEGSNSRMTLDLEACTYVVGVNSYSNGEVGAYELSIRCPDVRLCRDCEVGSIACGEMVDGFLEDGDCALADGTLIDSYTFTLERTSNVSITLRSADFDTALNLSDNFCETFLNNEDCDPGNFEVSCIESVILNPGTYTIGASSAGAGESGLYQLEVACEPANACGDCDDGEIECPALVDGILQTDDCSLENGRLFDSYRLEVAETQDYVLSLVSGNIDTFLYLYNGENCEEISFDDDGGDGINSRLELELSPGTYWILPSCVDPATEGTYTLEVTCNEPGPCPPCETGEVTCGKPLAAVFPLQECTRSGGQSEDIYVVTVEAGALNINLSSSDFDTHLTVYTADCEVLGFNDNCDPADVENSCLALEVAAGTYYLGISSYEAGEQGAFSLTVTCGENEEVDVCLDCLAGELLPEGSQPGEFPGDLCAPPVLAEPANLWRLELAEPFAGSILLESSEFDPILELKNVNCENVTSNDDCDQTTVNSCLEVELDPGIYFLAVRSFEAGGSGSYTLSLQPETGPVRSIGPFLRGDVDQNASLQLTDAVAIFSYLFLGGVEPGCLAAADSDGTGEINLTSGVFLLRFLFLGGSTPMAPYPQCDRSSRETDLGLGCRRPQNCF